MNENEKVAALAATKAKYIVATTCDQAERLYQAGWEQVSDFTYGSRLGSVACVPMTEWSDARHGEMVGDFTTPCWVKFEIRRD